MGNNSLDFESLVLMMEQTHQHFQQQAVKAVNFSLTVRNWLIGFYIAEFELNGRDRANYGDKLFDVLAQHFIHVKGIDRRSLYRFKEFYIYYPQLGIEIKKHTRFLKGIAFSSIVGSVTPQLKNNLFVPGEVILNNLSYTHIEQLLSLSDPLKRRFYENAAIEGTWSVNELKRQIHSLYYERSGMSLKPEMLKDLNLGSPKSLSLKDVIKSVYAFEFLGLKDKDAVEENDLETSLLDHLQEFMVELGYGFCFEARQKKILIGDEYFFIDLVFYHRILKCHILVELKVEEFNHHNIGQLNTYVSYFRTEIMQSDDNPTIGILLVTNKNKALVEYATSGIDNKLFVSKYLIELPKKEDLEAFIVMELTTHIGL